MFQLESTIYLYDLTNTYFEGSAKRNPKAEYNKNQKEKRSDCPQVVIALVLDGLGFVRRHFTFKGKMSDSESLAKILEKLESDFDGLELPTIVFDRGVATDKNIKLLKSKSLHYIVACRSGEEKQFIDDFKNDVFKVLKSDKDNEVKISLKREGDETFLLCKSEGRKKKETAMRNNREKKLETDLASLKALIETGKRNNPTDIERAIGRFKERHSSAAHYYEIEFSSFSFTYQISDESSCPKRLLNSLKKLKEKADAYKVSYLKVESKLTELAEKYKEAYPHIATTVIKPNLTWKTEDEKKEELVPLDGNYLLKTDRKDLADNEIWKMYVMLTRVEKAFRNFKSDLALRPNFHQKEERVEGHIFITVLAYHLLHSIEVTLRGKGCHSSWATIKRVVSSHIYATIILPTTDDIVIHVRKPGRPEAIHTQIYEMLNIDYKKLPITKIFV